MTDGGMRKRLDFRFAPVPHDTADDDRVSFRALGVLAKLLRLPDGWDVRSEDLAKGQNREGRDAIRTALKELAAAGYYRLERRHLRNGQFRMGTAVSAFPVPTWANEYQEFDGRPVPVVEQEDGSFLVKHQDGSLSADGFDPPPPPADSSPEADAELADELTGDGKPGAGISGPGEPAPGNPAPAGPAGNPAPGNPASGGSGPLSRRGREEEELSKVPVGRGEAPSAVADPIPPDQDSILNGGSPFAASGNRTTGVEQGFLLPLEGGAAPVGRIPYTAGGWPDRTPRGVRLAEPADFRVTPQMVAWAQENCPLADGRVETAKFVDHFVGASGSNAAKRDWGGTWRNWMRRAQDDAAQRAARMQVRTGGQNGSRHGLAPNTPVEAMGAW